MEKIGGDARVLCDHDRGNVRIGIMIGEVKIALCVTPAEAKVLSRQLTRAAKRADAQLEMIVTGGA